MFLKIAFRRYAPLLVALQAAFSAGCGAELRADWRDKLVWSPDGKRAVVLGKGLRLTDPDGNLTPLLDEHAYRVAWLNDSEHIVVARSRTVTTFAEVAAAVGPERTEEIVAEAEHVWLHIQSPDWPQNIEDFVESILNDEDAIFVYLRELHRDALRDRAAEEWASIEETSVKLHALVLVHAAGDRLEPDLTLSEDVTPIRTIQPAPDGRTIAFVTENEGLIADHTIRTYVVPSDARAPAARIAEGTGRFPGWLPDSRTFIYFNVAGAVTGFGGFGCLATQALVGDEGTVRLKDNSPTCLVYLVFDEDDRVQWLPGGRVLFSAIRAELPSVGYAGRGPAQLFAFDPTRTDVAPTPLIADALLEREALAFFELSPDRTRIIYSTRVGNIRLLTIADGRTELLPLGLYRESGYSVSELPRAVWTGPDAFTYVKKIGSRNEFVLRRGSDETILSRNWPNELLPPASPD